VRPRCSAEQTLRTLVADVQMHVRTNRSVCQEHAHGAASVSRGDADHPDAADDAAPLISMKPSFPSGDERAAPCTARCRGRRPPCVPGDMSKCTFIQRFRRAGRTLYSTLPGPPYSMRVLTSVTGHSAVAATARDSPPTTNASVAVSLPPAGAETPPRRQLRGGEEPQQWGCTMLKQSIHPTESKLGQL
jgi:hypothetical protein